MVTSAQIADVFRNGLNHLWDGKWGVTHTVLQLEFICYAIRVVDNKQMLNKDLSEAQRDAGKIILERIAPCITLDGWLYEKGVKCATLQQYQKHRIEWMKLLIEEFSAK